jgi:hypothetical protein
MGLVEIQTTEARMVLMPYANGFVKRHPNLLRLEGWYSADGYRFKISCRFNDILRCSIFSGKHKHFVSCFAPWAVHGNQPKLRCRSPLWAIAYTPDEHGDFMGRAFIQFRGSDPEDKLYDISPVYGNRLQFNDVKNAIKSVNTEPVIITASGDIYL